MARTLIILRHGKAEPDSHTGLDQDRELSRRGLRQIDYVAEQLLDRDRKPVFIAASFVKRARQSADALAEALEAAGVPCELRRERALEFGHDSATTDGLGAVVAGLLRTHKRGPVMLVGHNPQLERLVNLMESPQSPADVPLKTGMACVFAITDPAEPLSSATLQARIRHEA